MPTAPISSAAAGNPLVAALMQRYLDEQAAQPAAQPNAAANTSFGAIMDLAGQLRPTDPNEAARLDRYAQGISTRNMPGYNPVTDIPVNAALATGYEGTKALAAVPQTAQAVDTSAVGPTGAPTVSVPDLARKLLEVAGYGRKSTGQATSDPSLANVIALIQGMTGS